MELTDEFVRRLKAAIDADPKLTVAGVAKKAGLSDATVRQAISKNAAMTTRSQEAITQKVFNTSVADFMSDSIDQSRGTEAQLHSLIPQLTPDERLRLLGVGEGILASRPAEDQE